MEPIDILVLAIVVLIVGGAALYIYKAKKRGTKCIGCPSANQCKGQCANCPHSCKK